MTAPEVPAGEGTLHREQWEEMLFQHRPVASFNGSIAGCTCLDRVFYKGREDWDTHLTDVILPTLAAELQKARAEVIDWIEDYDPLDVAMLSKAREKFLGGAS